VKNNIIKDGKKMNTCPTSTYPHFRLFRLLTSLVLLVLVAACNLSTTGGNIPLSNPGSVNPTATPTIISEVPEDPLADVLYSLRLEYQSAPFRIYTTIDSGSSQLESTLEVESPQRILQESATGSLIIVDGQCYEQPVGGDWRTCDSPSLGEGISSMFDQSFIDANLAMIDAQSVELVAREDNPEGILCRIYEYKVSGDSFGVHTEGTVRLWVEDSSRLPVKLVTTSSSNGYSAVTTQEIEYDPGITVSAP